MSVSLHLHSALIHSIICTKKTIRIKNYFQNRWSHDSIVEPTYVLMGSPGHYQLIIIFLKLSFFSSHILHDICLNKLFVIAIVIVSKVVVAKIVMKTVVIMIIRIEPY